MAAQHETCSGDTPDRSAQHREAQDAVVQDAAGATAPARGERVLLVVVIVLGILLIVGFAIVVATIASRIASSGEEAQTPPPAAAPVTASGDVAVPVPPGYRIHAVTGDGRRLILHLRGPQGQPERIMVVDARDGRVLRSLVLTPRAP